MSEQDARTKNFAFNYQSDIFNQKAPVKAEYNYSHKGFQPNSSNKTSSNFLSWEDHKQPSSNQKINPIKRNENIEQTKPKVHQNFESKLYNTEPKQNTDNNRGQKETLFLGDYKGEEYKIKRQKNNEYNPNLYYKTKKANQTYNEHIYGKINNPIKPAIARSKNDNKINENNNDNVIKNNQNTNKKLESLNVERSTNNEYNPKFDPKQNRVNMLKSNIFNDDKREEINKKEGNKFKDIKIPQKRKLNDKKDNNFGKKSKFDKNAEKLPMNLDWRDTKTNLLFNGEMNKDIMKKDARQRKFEEIYGTDPVIPKERTENNFKTNDRKLIEKTTKEINPEFNQAKIKKISENISQIQGNEFLNDSSKYKIKNNNAEDNIKLYEINAKNINQKEIERAFAEKGIRIYDVKEKVDSIFGVNKDNKITFKIRDNENDKDFNAKIKNVQNDFKNKRNVEIKPVSQQEKKQADLIPNSIKWDNTNVNSLIKNRNIDKTQQEKTHSKPIENNNNEQKMTQIFVNLKYKNEQSII